MRRKDREVTDSKIIEDIIRRCTCLRIGFYDDGEVIKVITGIIRCGKSYFTIYNLRTY